MVLTFSMIHYFLIISIPVGVIAYVSSTLLMYHLVAFFTRFITFFIKF
nr:MAG TPA: hypothetical protein [Bacteriophage sp.]